MSTPAIRALLATAVLVAAGLVWRLLESPPRAAAPATASSTVLPSSQGSPAARSPAADGVPAAGVAASDPRAGEAAGGTERPVLSRRFPQARVMQERLERTVEGRDRWVQWLRTEGTYPDVLAELEFETTPEGPRLVTETYVLADSVVLARPAGMPPEVFAERLARLGLRAGPQYPFSPATRVFVPTPLHLDSVRDALARLGAAEPAWKAEPDPVAFTQTVPNDFDSRQLWALARVNAPAAWQLSTGSTDLVVAVIDSGLSRQHPDLAANVWINPNESGNGLDDDGNGLIDDRFGWDFAGNDADPADVNGHGTHVAGIVGAVGNNGAGLTGAAWRVRIMGLRTGDETLATSAVIQATDYVTAQKTRGIPVVAINNSYTSSSFNSLQRDSIQRARDADILFVAAAGNDGRNINQSGLLYPIGYAVSTIVGVASTNLGDTLSDFSNWGPSSVHVAAPGSAILSTLPGDTYGIKDGTSMAAPLVAGAAVLLRAAEPTLSAAQIKTRLVLAATPVEALAGRVSSDGRLDLQRLVNPSASLPKLTALAPTADVYAVDSVAQSVVLAVRGTRVVSGVDLDELPVTWSKLTGPGTVTFTSAGANRVSASFSLAGLYRLQAIATHGGLTASLERTIIVGPATVAPTALEAQWTFGEPSGPALDSSGKGRTATFLDNPTRDSGPFLLPGLRFSGTLAAARFAAPGPSQVTLAGWIRMDSAGNSIFPRILHFPAYYLFAGRDTSSTGADGNRGTVKFLANWTGSDGVWHSEPGLVGNDAWYHFAATYDSSAGLSELPRLFLNGRELTVAAQTRPAGLLDLAEGAGFIGNNEERTRALAGRLADVRIYSRRLGGEEIATLARGPLLDDLRPWTAVVRSTAAGTVVVGLQLPDGRLPTAGLTPVWQSITGPGAPAITATQGAEATLTFTQTGDHVLTVDLFSSGVMLRRQMTLALPGTVAPPVAPSFVRHPASRTVASGGNVVIDVEAAGTPPLSYQWLKDGQPVNGQIMSQIVLPAVRVADAGRYSVRVTNAAGTATSSEGVLTVLDPPSITAQPQGQIAAAGSRVELTVVAAGSPPLTYQWNRGGQPIPGATSPVLVLDAVSTASNGAYTVTVTNAVGSVTSNPANIEVLQPPAIVSQPPSQTVIAGRTIVFEVSVSGTVPYTFAWFKNGQLMPGETQPTLRFTIVRLEDAGTYTFRVSNAVGTATTTPIVLTVVSGPIIVRQPATQAVPLGRPATFSVEVTGTAPITYQWMLHSAPIPGATGAQYVIPAVGREHIGAYTVTATNAIDSVRSAVAHLDIVPTAQITQHPAGAVVAAGASVTLEAKVADAPGTVFARWWHNGLPVSGASALSLNLSSIGLAQAGIYVAELTNSGGTVFTKPALVAVTVAGKTAGAVGTRPEWQNIRHPNGNVYDQHLLEGAVGAMTADPGEISRMSFLDPQGDIVQVEMAGAGAVIVLLDGATGPVAPALYSQTGVAYMQGQATLLLVGADASTYVSAFSVGPANNPGATRPDVTYEGWATLRAAGVHAPGGAVGGLRFGNGRFEASSGATGLWAPGVQAPTLFLHDVAAFSQAVPVLGAAAGTEVGITGGSLLQPNGRAVMLDGVGGIRLRAGTSSTGQVVGPRSLQGRLERDGVDVSSTIILPSS